MKTRKAIFVLFMLGCLAAFSAMAANAANSWVICTVDQVGPSGTSYDSGSRIFLTAIDPAGAWTGSKECIIYYIRRDDFLATALTALASGKKVKVFVDRALLNPTIGAIYVRK